MPRLKVLRPHAKPVGIGVFRVGDVYDESPLAAEQKVQAGFVEYVGSAPARNKAAPELYEQISVRSKESAEVKAVSRKGAWYFLSDGEKVLGKSATAERLGVEPEELDDVPVDDG